MKANKWYVITGGPSTGKTTLLSILEKSGYETVPEAARLLIDRDLKQGKTIADIRSNEEDFQNNVFELKTEIESKKDANIVTFFDRGMHDSLAYLRYYNYEVKDEYKRFFENARYKQVFLLEPLPIYEQNYARTENAQFTNDMKKFLYDAYKEYGMPPIEVPVMSPQERVDYILERL